MKLSVKYLYHLLIACLLVAQGCQVQQRRYTGGWSIQWPSPNTKKAKLTGSVNKSAEPTVAVWQSKTEAINIINPQKSESYKLQNVEISGHAIEPKNQGENSDVRPSLTCNKTVQPTYPYQTRKTNGKNMRLRHQLQRQQPGDPWELIFLIVGIIGMLLGYDSYSGGGGGGWGGGGGGGYFDWTAFFAIAGATASTGGLILTIALKSSMSASGLEGMMVFFTLFGTLLNTIGLIKSIRDYYDVGKYLSIAGFALLGIMWIIGLS